MPHTYLRGREALHGRERRQGRARALMLMALATAATAIAAAIAAIAQRGELGPQPPVLLSQGLVAWGRSRHKLISVWVGGGVRRIIGWQDGMGSRY